VTKGPEAFRTISEAAQELGVAQHVLRFWETKFSFIRPMKRAGGRRFYRPQDLDVLRGVQSLLHEEGYTIKGVQRLHKEHGVKRLLVAAPGPTEEAEPAVPSDLQTEDGSPVLMPHKGPSRRLAPASEWRLREALDELEMARARLTPLVDGS
jgi:DNA-binding transcriptional MerR regulator